MSACVPSPPLRVHTTGIRCRHGLGHTTVDSSAAGSSSTVSQGPRRPSPSTTRRASLWVTVTMGTTPRLRHEDKGPLHHTWPDELRPFGTGMAEPLRAPVFHIADVLGRSATIATPRPQRTIRRAGVGPEQDCDDPGPRMGIHFGRLPPREGKTAPGFLWREAKQRTSRRRLLHTH